MSRHAFAFIIGTVETPTPNRRFRTCWRWTGAVLALAVLGLLDGCAVVAPHKRETLARRDMTLAPEADLAAGAEHARAYREGSSGGGAVQAGGCGCN